jgi:hypothetical protein
LLVYFNPRTILPYAYGAIDFASAAQTFTPWGQSAEILESICASSEQDIVPWGQSAILSESYRVSSSQGVTPWEQSASLSGYYSVSSSQNITPWQQHALIKESIPLVVAQTFTPWSQYATLLSVHRASSWALDGSATPEGWYLEVSMSSSSWAEAKDATNSSTIDNYLSAETL